MKSKLPQALLWLFVWATLGMLIWLINMPQATQSQIEAEYLAKLAQQTPTPTPEPTPFRVRMMHYQLLRNGMSIAQCETLIGKAGQEQSRAGDGPNEFVPMAWINPGGSNLVATFQGGRLISKTQIGLR
jgi:hypothetical protein